jgi:hypothetical protein
MTAETIDARCPYCAQWYDRYGELLNEVRKGEMELREMRVALSRYGRHKSWCAGCDPAKQDDFCTCGLNDALALGTGGRSRSDRTEGPPLSTAKGNAQSPRLGSQGDSAHTPKTQGDDA